MWPSTLLRLLLVRLLGQTLEDHLGDLDEEFNDRILPTRNRIAAEAWYLSEALSLLVAMARDPRAPRTLSPNMYNGLRQDIRSAFRSLLRDPAVTAVVGLTLTLATGSMIAMFALADAAFLRPLPYPSEDRLVRFYTGFDGGANAVSSLSPLDVRGIRGSADLIEEVGVWTQGESAHLTDVEEPLRLVAPRASAGLFRILGARPALGRFFTSEDEVPGQDGSVVLSHRLWTDAYGADPDVLGRTIQLDNRSYQVIGVAPANGMLPNDADLWRALALGPEWYQEDRWGWQFLATVARLTPTTDLETATDELNHRLAEETSRVSRLGQSRILHPLRAELMGDSRIAIAMLTAAATLILVMACLNIVNILLARSEARLHEFGLRRALGSGAARLGRLVALETLALAAVGSVGGLVLAGLALRTVRARSVEALASLGPLSIDPPVAFFTLFLMGLAAAAFGLAPLLESLRVDPRDSMGTGSTKVAGSRSASRMRAGLVATQVALSVILLVVAGLSITTYRSIVARNPGFDPTGVLAAAVELPAGTPSEEAFALYRTLTERLSSLPGVTSASAANYLPLDGVGWSASFEILVPDPQMHDPDPGANMRAVLPGYFATMRIPVVEGRAFTEADAAGATPVVVVDETVAHRFWPTSSPIGKQVMVGGLSMQPATVVGIVGDVPHERLDRRDGGHVYFPLLQRALRGFTLVVRSTGDPLALAGPVRGALRELAPRMPITRISSLQARIGESLAGARMSLMLLGIFGTVAVLLAAVGVYGVLSYTVARRTREIGTRIALGAAPHAVLAGVLGQALRYWAAGVVAGGVGAALAVGWLTRVVTELQRADPVIYLAVPVVLAVITTVAALIPARRATTVDPSTALRMD